MSENANIFKGCTNHSCVYAAIYLRTEGDMGTNGSCRCDAWPVISALQVQCEALKRQHKDLVDRNQVLRTRPDLPMTDPQKALYKQLETDLARTKEECRWAMEHIINTPTPDSLDMTAYQRTVAWLKENPL